MDNTNRAAALNRIRALMAKTVANGCSESEAMAAAAKVSELMDRYGLTYSDFEIKQERCRKRQATDRRHDVNLVACAIARFCNCRHWLEDGRIQYFGLPVDVTIATYMTDLCRSAMDVGFKRFVASDLCPWEDDVRTLRKPFMVAMAYRLSERFDAMADARGRTAMTADGTSLVVVTNAVVEKQYLALKLKLTPGRAPRYRDNAAAEIAGRAAGDRVNLVPGINTAPGRRRLRS
jgi:hypothetical protein